MPVTAKCWPITLVTTLFISSFSLTAIASEYRCGWLENPTADNFWLHDKDGNWTITSEDGYSVAADSIDRLPEVNDEEYVQTNGYYGYSCGCLSVTTDKNTRRVVSIDTKGKQELLKTCLENQALRSKKSVPAANVATANAAPATNTSAAVSTATDNDISTTADSGMATANNPPLTVRAPAATPQSARTPIELMPHLIQTFSTYDVNKANTMKQALNQSAFPTLIQQGEYKGKPIYRVRVGPFPNKRATIEKQNELKRFFKDNPSIQNSIVIKDGGW